ncbi:MAG TPA: hypothetical protein PKO33_04055 [Pyrinomonadaceae bacterium]|nr:hypothetical protein [Pyrinomonadaceae bacterium]
MRNRFCTVCLAAMLFGGSVCAQSARPNLTTIPRTDLFPIRTKLTKEQKERMLPDPRDVDAFRTVLEQPRTGIARLHPDLGCYENARILKADETCQNAIPEGSSYSFRERENTIEVLSDIRLKGGYFISDGILTQGFMTNLGDADLVNVDLESQGLAFVRAFEPMPEAHDAKDQYTSFVKGIKTGVFEYRKFQKAVVGSTYAMRIVAYRGNVYRSYRGWKFDLLEGDKRIDLIVAFRVVRQSPDGSLTIVWKELERRDSPRLRFTKRRDPRTRGAG